MDLNWSTEMTATSRKASLLEDEREPHSLMMDSDVTQHSMDSLDEFNSDAEFNKLERSRTMPVSALYATIQSAEEDQQMMGLANGRSYSMSSIGSLWDQEYKQRANAYNKEQDTRQEMTRPESPPSQGFRLHTPIPEEDDYSSSSNESITYVFMNPNKPTHLNSENSTNPSAILRRSQESRRAAKIPDHGAYGRSLSQQPRSLSIDSIDVEKCLNYMRHKRPERVTEDFDDEIDTSPQSTLERRPYYASQMRRDNSRLHIESTDQEFSGVERTPYYVESATTDHSGSEVSPRRQTYDRRRTRKDSESDYDSNRVPTERLPSFPPRSSSTINRRSSTKTRRKPNRTKVMETQTDEEITGYSSQPDSPVMSRRHFNSDNYALMRSITAESPLRTALERQHADGKIEPTINLLTEVVSLMKLMVSNMPQQNHHCQKCHCSSKCNEQSEEVPRVPQKTLDVKPTRPNKLNFSSFTDSAPSDPEPSPVADKAFKEGFLIERFRQSRQDRIATCSSMSDIASCVSDVEPDSLRMSGASTPTDDFRSFPIPPTQTPKYPTIVKHSPTGTADSGLSDRWESQGSSCGSTASRRNHSRTSSDSMSAGPSSLSSNDTHDSLLKTTTLTQWNQLNDEPIRTSTPVATERSGRRSHAMDNNVSSDTAFSYKSATSYLSRIDSLDELEERSHQIATTRPSKLVMQLEKKRNEALLSGKRKPLDELKEKWQTPCDLIPADNFLPLPSQTKLRCSPDVHRTL